MDTDARKIIVYIATSADGYIARPDGAVDWLDRPAPKGHYGMATFMRSIDTILWGRKTWDIGLELGGDATRSFGRGVKHYVFSRQPRESDEPSVEWTNEAVPSFARRLRAAPGKNVWMMGGGELIAAFLDAGELDEFMIHVVPVFIGEGIPLMAPRHRHIELTLESSRRYDDGVVHLHYALPRPS